jgi:hypothetical protein
MIFLRKISAMQLDQTFSCLAIPLPFFLLLQGMGIR